LQVARARLSRRQETLINLHLEEQLQKRRRVTIYLARMRRIIVVAAAKHFRSRV